MPEEEFHSILAMIQQAYIDSKKVLITVWLLRCLTALAQAQVAIDVGLSICTQNMCESIWQNIWSTSLRWETMLLVRVKFESRVLSRIKDLAYLF